MCAMCVCGNRSKLRERRKQIKLTLDFLRAERRGVEQNAPSMDPEAFRRRMRLFDCLAGWYEHETEEIESALRDAKTYD